MLMWVSFHFVNVAADWMVIPFSRSSSMLSILAPTPSLPRTCGSSKQRFTGNDALKKPQLAVERLRCTEHTQANLLQ